jgi:crooked neck
MEDIVLQKRRTYLEE